RYAAGVRLLRSVTMAVTCAGLLGGLAANATDTQRNSSAPAELRATIAEMKASAKGPFSRIRWFCRDGSVLPPVPSACRNHGGGVQHGELSDRAKRLRNAGFGVANVLASIPPGRWTGPAAELDTLRDLVLERFLIQADDGWIFRGARTYRGAFQAEDEEAAAGRLLGELVTDPAWENPARFLLLRELARLLPSAVGGGSTEVRQLAAELAEADGGFAALRNKIHSWPEASDARRVREYAKRSPRAGLAERQEQLARQIDSLFDPSQIARDLETLASALQRGPLAERLIHIGESLRRTERSAERLTIASAALASLRDRWRDYGAAERSAALQAIGSLERTVFVATSAPRETALSQSRRQGVERLGELREALYGCGLLSSRQRDALRAANTRIAKVPKLTVGEYRRELRYLDRAAEWAARSLEFHFQERVQALAILEPLVREFIPDRVRGSPLLAWNAITEVLQEDAGRLAGARHEVFGESVGTGLRGLNPGLARGVLAVGGAESHADSFQRTGIYLLPNTVSELPPVAGILTRGAGSSLSHVQLLARNMGIPNVVVGEDVVGKIAARAGDEVVLAASPAGLVVIASDGPRWEAIFGRSEPASELTIRPDLEKLDLKTWRSASLETIRARDSGRIVGPKAANLGELHHRYPGAVPRGVVVPFGSFRRLVEQPIEAGGPSVFEWMTRRYAALEGIADPAAKKQATSEFLGKLRSWIETADPGEAFRQDLRASLERVLGPDGSWGVFVRSDTNVEDLSGFTGAGLNLTLPNVVGFENVLAAMGRVWASPFTDRAFAWRQSLMERPENVFPGVVLLESFPSEKSGVLVTADVDTGDTDWLSIAVSEGVGGAVEGQAAEELRVHRSDRAVRLLAQASAPRRAVLDREGGLTSVRASGSDRVLLPAEIGLLVRLAAQLPEHFPALAGAPTDVEFAFAEGRLALLQIRPFVESRRARRSLFLQSLDAPLERNDGRTVDPDGLPLGGGTP
ncbi:MAG: phosphoenolpyruvate synthase, partial [Myxococcales bacterium]|nr:phosphoenolpyruvate synthase [Myxococcales bacterium]